MPAFLYERNATGLRLAAARHDPAIHDNGLFEFATETIADHVTIGRDPFVDAHSNHGPRRQGQSLREHCLVRLPLGLRVRLLLRGRVRLSLGLGIRGCDGGLGFAGLILLSEDGGGTNAESQS